MSETPLILEGFDPEAVPPLERPRVLLYSHDGTGLGHLRIVLGITNDLAARRPDASFLLLTGSLQATSADLPPNVDYVKLPAMPKRHLYAGLPLADVPPTEHRHIIFVRNAIARATIEAYRPHLVVIDHAPAGLFRELAEPLAWLRQAPERPKVALLMRDITFGPGQTRTLWRNERVYDLLEDVYDRILVYGSREVFDPIREYGLSASVADKTVFCGYLAPPKPTESVDEVRARLEVGDRPLVALSVGGGGDGAPLLRAYLTGLRQGLGPDVASFVVSGPLLPEEDQIEIDRLATDLPHLHRVPFTPDWLNILHAADAVVCMGGYNAMVEAVHAGHRAVIVPRLPGAEEQVIRADRFARRGLVTVVPPTALSPERLWSAIRTTLARGVSPAGTLSFDGRRRVVAELAAMMPR